MKKIIILGGSFDPFHLGHIQIASTAYQTLHADEVWILVCKNTRWKQDLTPIEHRIKMIEQSILDYPYMKINLSEVISSDETLFTIDTIRQIKKENPQDEFFYLIGSDQLNKLHQWKEIKTLSMLIQFLVFSRPSYPLHISNLKQYHVQEIFGVQSSISSTYIRQNYALHYVKEEVKKYIIQNHLYIENYLKAHLSPKRFSHSLEVAHLAKFLASLNGVSQEDAYLAGLIHDCAKELKKEELNRIINEFYSCHIDEPYAILHQYAGEYLAEHVFFIKNREILTGVRKHATADKNMSIFDKIIYISDKIEPTRNYSVQHLYEACINNLDKGYNMVFQEIINIQIKKGLT